MSREISINPYENINWSNVKKYKANFHQHSTESDGLEHVAILIDQAKALGMDVFTVSDHDSYRVDRGKYPKVLNVSDPNAEYYDPNRPDGRFRNIFPYSYFDGDVYYDPNNSGNYSVLAREGTLGEFDIDENGFMQGMLALEGAEFTENHHMISIANSVDGYPGGKDEEKLIKEVDNRGGVIYFAHPGDHSDPVLGRNYKDKYNPQWYRNLLSKYESCLGLEVFNQGDRFRNDRKLWDHLNNIGFDAIPIWGFSGTDSHASYNKRNHNVLFMNNLNVEEMKACLKNGSFYFVYGNQPPEINSIEVDEQEKTITINTVNPYDEVVWVSGGLEVFTGNQLNYAESLGISKYVRAIVKGRDGTSMTNPVYFSEFVRSYTFI